jgi:7-alpha-hydroxysteroid dehydrogenase
MTDTGPLRGYGVLVTGGGTGIGRACAVELASRGASVVICGRTEDRLKGVVADLDGQGWPASYVVADVTNEDDVRKSVDATIAFAGNLKGVVANAGGGGGMGPYHLQDKEEYARVLELNVVGTMLFVKHSVAPMVQAGGGSFVGSHRLPGPPPMWCLALIRWPKRQSTT